MLVAERPRVKAAAEMVGGALLAAPSLLTATMPTAAVAAVVVHDEQLQMYHDPGCARARPYVSQSQFACKAAECSVWPSAANAELGSCSPASELLAPTGYAKQPDAAMHAAPAFGSAAEASSRLLIWPHGLRVSAAPVADPGKVRTHRLDAPSVSYFLIKSAPCVPSSAWSAPGCTKPSVLSA